MLFKKKNGIIKLNILANKANPSPPIGPALGQKGINIVDFCKNFNKESFSMDSNFLIPVIIKYYSDKSYDFFLKKPTISFYIKTVFSDNILKLNFSNLLEIVKFKISDFNTSNLHSSIKIVIGVLKSMKIFLKC